MDGIPKNVVRNENGDYEVIDRDGNVLAGGFTTEEQAWTWFDNYYKTEF